MNGLPQELLAEIFLHCMPPSDQRLAPSASYAPLSFTRVCQQWRSTAIATPGLWSNIRITLGPVLGGSLVPPSAFAEFQRMVTSQKEGAIRWLTWAGNTPTHVRFRARNGHDLSNVSFYLRNQAMKLILESLEEICVERFTTKWQTLEISGTAGEDILSHPYRAFFLSIPLQSLTSLQTLHYSYCPFFTYPAEQEPTLRFNQLTFRDSGMAVAQALKAVHIGSLSNNDRLDILLPWYQLVDLTLKGGYQPGTYFTPDEVLGILRQCAGTLQRLSVDVGEAMDESPTPAIITLFPALAHLDVSEMTSRDESASHLQTFMTSLRAPNLKRLQFWTGCSPEHAFNDEVSSLLAFARAHRKDLTNLANLEFEYNAVNPEELKELLAIMGGSEMSVTCLKLEGSWVTYRDMGGPCPYATLDEWVLGLFNPPKEGDLLEQGSDDTRKGMVRESASNKSTTPLFPHLQRFWVRLAKDDEFTDEDLLTFLRPRLQHHSNSISRLTNVYVGFVMEDPTIDVMEELRGMSDVSLEGVQIDIDYELERVWGDI